MTSKLTREEMQELISALRLTPTSTVNGISLGRVANALSESMAALDSEPVGEFYEDGPLNWYQISDGDRVPAHRRIPLYRHAQQPVVMDDTKLRELFDSWFASDCSFDLSPEASEADNIAWRESYWYVWQRCRAAMLQAQSDDGGEPTNDERIMAIEGIIPPISSGNSPVTPDGWIPVSERTPPSGGSEQRYVLAADFKNHYWPNIPNTQVGVYGDWFSDGNPTWDDGDGEDLHLKEVTHWTPLPAAPQELKP